MTTPVFSRLATELKRRRESKRLSRDKVAKQLRVPVSTVIQLENPVKSTIPVSYQEGLYRRYGQLLNYDADHIEKLIENSETILKSAPSKPNHRRFKPLVIASTFQKAMVATVVTLLGGYALWQFGLLFAPPGLALDNPAPRIITSDSTISLSGTADPGSILLINADLVTVEPDGRFEHTLYLQPGYNAITLSSRNNFGRQRDISQVIILETDENFIPVIDEQG